MENLSNIGTIKEILTRHGFGFSKALGQNFLVNPSVCPKMARLCGADSDCGVLEIGPGIGVLTNELAKVSKKVVAVELDRRLLPVLDETLSDCSNVKIINGDILKIDLKELLNEEFPGMRVVVCANLPYYITSPVIMRLLEERLPIDAVTVMVQKEAAERICAPMGTRQSGALTAAVSFYSKAEMLFNVSAGSFMPPPKVDSCVIRLDVLREPSVKVSDEKMFFKVVKAAFSQRRKTLANALSSGLGMDKQAVNSLLEKCGISARARAEQLSMEEFGRIADSIIELRVES